MRFLLVFVALLACVAGEDSHERMVALLTEVRNNAIDDHPILGETRLNMLRAQLARLGPNPHPQQAYDLLTRLGMEELAHNQLDRAIELLSKADEIVNTIGQKVTVKDEVYARTAWPLAIAFMRLGETENCCLRHTPDSCILPIRGGGLHAKKRGSQEAIGYFEKVLARTPIDHPRYLKARWLLNICYMTLGTYPDKVPEAWRIPPSVFQGKKKMPRFYNVAPRLGLDRFDLAGGAVADDFDGDGDLDLLCSSYDPAEHPHLYRNNGDGSFVDVSEAANLSEITGGFNMVQADYNNDGHLDVYVLRGGWQGPAGKIPNSLLRNNGDGSFTDVTFAAGLAEPALPSHSAAWADFDLDGDLDLYVAAEHTPQIDAPCQLFRNNGDGTFTDIAETAGVTNRRFAKAVVWGDVNDDGLPDIYVSNVAADNRLYLNKGDGSFEDVAPKAGVVGPAKSFPVWFFDYDNDGSLDLYAASYDWDGGSLGSVVADRLGLPYKDETPRLYKGDGKGGFVDVSKAAGIDHLSLPMGANFGDLNGDGLLDFYLGTGYPDYEALIPNVMYLNTPSATFEEVTFEGGFGHLQKGHAVVFADINNDGSADIYQQVGGFLKGDKYGNILFANPKLAKNWLSLKLVGKTANRSAIGARIEAVLEEAGQTRRLFRTIGSGGSFGANPLRCYLGLGNARRVKSLSIKWPSSTGVQTIEDLETNRFLVIEEGKAPRQIKPATFAWPEPD